jgi:hypothetical protein
MRDLLQEGVAVLGHFQEGAQADPRHRDWRNRSPGRARAEIHLVGISHLQSGTGPAGDLALMKIFDGRGQETTMLRHVKARTGDQLPCSQLFPVLDSGREHLAEEPMGRPTHADPGFPSLRDPADERPGGSSLTKRDAHLQETVHRCHTPHTVQGPSRDDRQLWAEQDPEKPGSDGYNQGAWHVDVASLTAEFASYTPSRDIRARCCGGRGCVIDGCGWGGSRRRQVRRGRGEAVRS